VAVFGIGSVIGTERAADRQEDKHRVTVTYWEKWTGDEAKAMQRAVNAFNDSQDKIFVKYLSISSVADKTLLATAGGNPPDVAGLWHDQVVQYADIGALTDMTDMAKAAGITEANYIPAFWKTINYKGRLYALPTSVGVTALHVNRDLMPPQYNTPETFPKTLSEFEKMIAMVSKKAPDGHMEVAAFLPRDSTGSGSWPYLFGGSLVTPDRQINVNGPDDMKAWTWVHSFAERFGTRATQEFRSGFGNYSSPQNPFLSGKIATFVDGPWFSNFIRLYNPKVNWFAVPFPYPDDRPDLKGFTVLAQNVLMIPRGAKHVKEAFEFIRFVQRQDIMERLCQDQRCNSPLQKVSDHFLSTHPNKYIRVFDQLARSGKAVGPLPVGVANQVAQEVSNAVESMDLGQQTPKAALDGAQARLDVIWSKYKEQVLGE